MLGIDFDDAGLGEGDLGDDLGMSPEVCIHLVTEQHSCFRGELMILLLLLSKSQELKALMAGTCDAAAGDQDEVCSFLYGMSQ